MKSIIKAIVIATTFFSVNSVASTAIDSLSYAAIKESLTPAQIESVLNEWRDKEMSMLEVKAQTMSAEGASIQSRRMKVKNRIDTKYEYLRGQLGL